MKKQWIYTGETCPKCNEHMIMNKTGEECGGFHCDYRKNNDPLNFDGLDVLLAKQVTMLETENGELYQEVVKLREENRILKENKK